MIACLSIPVAKATISRSTISLGQSKYQSIWLF